MELTREELEAKLDEVQQNIAIEKQRGPEKNDVQIATWEQEEAAILAQMDEVAKQEATAQIETAHQERVQQSVNTIASDLDQMEAGGISIRQLFASESEYQLGRIALQRWAENRESGLLEDIRGADEQIAQLKRQNEYLQGRVRDADAKTDQLTIELADTESKRDAAARELADANAQIEQLKSWNNDLQKQIAVGARGAIRVIDVEEEARRDAEEKAAGERVRIERFTVYDLKPDREYNPTKYTAKRAFDNEPCEIPAFALKGGAYTVLNSPDEVYQFWLQHAIETEPVAADGHDDHTLDQPETLDIPAVQPVTEAQFPEAHAVETVSASDPMAEMAGTEDKGVVSREEFDQLKKAVDVAYVRLRAVEDHVMGEGAA